MAHAGGDDNDDFKRLPPLPLPLPLTCQASERANIFACTPSMRMIMCIHEGDDSNAKAQCIRSVQFIRLNLYSLITHSNAQDGWPLSLWPEIPIRGLTSEAGVVL